MLDLIFKVKLTAMPFMKYSTMTNPIYPGDIIKGAVSNVTATVVENYNFGLTGTLILSKISGTFYPAELIVDGSGVTKSTTYRAVATNVATITTSTPHNINVGFYVTISGMADSTYNGTYPVASVPSPTTFTYALTHGNEGSTSDTGGTVLLSPNRATNVVTNGFAVGPSFTSYASVVQFFTSYVDQTTLYPVSTPTISFTGLKPYSEIRIYDNNMVEIAGTEDIGNTTTWSTTYDYYSDFIGYAVIMSLNYQVYRLDNLTFGINGLDIPVQQQLDRQYLNP